VSVHRTCAHVSVVALNAVRCVALSVTAGSLFGLHLEEESAGKVTLRLLEHSNAQFVRCRRAFMENTKKEFFPLEGRYQGARMAVQRVVHSERAAVASDCVGLHSSSRASTVQVWRSRTCSSWSIR
jgi:hypothetical protein